MSKYKQIQVSALIDPVTNALVGIQGIDGLDYVLPTVVSGPSGSGMLPLNQPVANLAKVLPNNGATTTYTLPAGQSYAYITTTAASLAVTLPAASALNDGMCVTIVTSAGVATATWVSTGATFVGAPGAFVANTPVRMIYDNASLKWYPL